ncbi:MAG TPA: S-layer homology domain-containing protein [Ruminiclostridium sp.]|nr:S-layer homology domain-containing protein [Ruminiclostridium sp.]
MNNIRKIIAVVLGIALLSQVGAVKVEAAAEQVVNLFNATQNGQAIINNLRYTDITNAAYDLKDAVYQNGALALFLSPGSTRFSPDASISKEMALYLVYMAANRSQDINTQGQTLNNTRTAAKKKTNLQAVLYDGSLQLAAKDGLISQNDLADALQTGKGAAAFKRSAAVSRQEFAVWLAKALMLAPIYDQQELLNNFTDWKSVKADNAAYIEALLQNNIMSGNGSGKFNPNKAVTREQAARILKNAENIILPLRSMEKRTATIEKKQSIKDTSKGNQIDYVTYYVRNSDGLLDTITVGSKYQKPTTTSNEQNGKAEAAARTELPVYKNGKITSSKSLNTGDRIEYIAGTSDKVVLYARVLSGSTGISYKAAIVNSIDNTSRTINITPLQQKIRYPNEEILNPKALTYSDGSTAFENHSFSNNLVNALTKTTVDLTSIKPYRYMKLPCQYRLQKLQLHHPPHFHNPSH